MATLVAVPSTGHAQTLSTPADPGRAVAFSDACEDGWVRDDGSAETGYGWVPSVVEGIYVQEILAEDLPFPELRTVCVCWLRTRTDTDISFDVVFFTQQGEEPALQPYAVVPAQAADVPSGVTGRFYEVDVSGVELMPGTSYVGVRWNPSVDPFFFVCVDTSPATDPVQVFFIDDRAQGWGDVFNTLDPIFADHRAMMVRVHARFVTLLDVPTLGSMGAALLGVLLAAAALRSLRGIHSRRRGSG